METSIVRQRIAQTLERSRQRAAERRGRNEAATRAFGPFLDTVAIPLMRQIANILRAESYAFTVNTPGGSVRLASDRSADDFLELSLDTTGDEPRVMLHVSRSWGRRVLESERALGSPETLSEEILLGELLGALEPFVER
jgi:hypothetical protein